MKSRFPARVLIFGAAVARAIGSLWQRRHAKDCPDSILIAHHLLLGDTLMLTALLASLRRLYPKARIVMTLAKDMMSLYQPPPYAIEAVPYNPTDWTSVLALIREHHHFDLAIIPGDNRHALLARAMGAKWIIAFSEDRPVWKNMICDALVDFPTTPMALGDLFVLLTGSSHIPVFNPKDWPDQKTATNDELSRPYAVLHVGAGNPLRQWPADRWHTLAKTLISMGIQPVLCCGPKERQILDTIDPLGEFPAFSDLSLAQLRSLIVGSTLVVCLDSGASHIAKTTSTPTVVLYGPGHPELFGTGNFWSQNKFRSVFIDEVPCRNQHSMFKRERAWINRCSRKPEACHNENICMRQLSVEQVLVEIRELLEETRKSEH